MRRASGPTKTATNSWPAARPADRNRSSRTTAGKERPTTLTHVLLAGATRGDQRRRGPSSGR
eukprot:3296562-Alexandrium_andersonii.AAC.1